MTSLNVYPQIKFLATPLSLSLDASDLTRCSQDYFHAIGSRVGYKVIDAASTLIMSVSSLKHNTHVRGVRNAHELDNIAQYSLRLLVASHDNK